MQVYIYTVLQLYSKSYTSNVVSDIAVIAMDYS